MPTPAKLQVVQAYDPAPIAEIDTDDAAALELKLATATQVFRDRKGWLPVHQRVDVLRRLAALMETRRDHFSQLIAQEGGKPLTDAIVETTRAIDRVESWVTEAATAGAKVLAGGKGRSATIWSRRYCSSLRRTHECRAKKYSDP